jgi:hypothetical protein
MRLRLIKSLFCLLFSVSSMVSIGSGCKPGKKTDEKTQAEKDAEEKARVEADKIRADEEAQRANEEAARLEQERKALAEKAQKAQEEADKAKKGGTTLTPEEVAAAEAKANALALELEKAAEKTRKANEDAKEALKKQETAEKVAVEFAKKEEEQKKAATATGTATAAPEVKPQGTEYEPEKVESFEANFGSKIIVPQFESIDQLGTNGERSEIYMSSLNIGGHFLTAKVLDEGLGKFEQVNLKDGRGTIKKFIAGPESIVAAHLNDSGKDEILIIDNNTIKNSFPVGLLPRVAFVGENLYVFSANKGYYHGIKGQGADLKEIPGFAETVTAAVGSSDELIMASNGEVKGFDIADPAADLKDAFIFATKADLMMSEKVENGPVRALAIVGNKLLVGMGTNGDNTGGLAIIDLDDPKDIVRPAAWQNGWFVRSIDVGERGKTALISTSKGLIYFDGKTLFTISDNSGDNSHEIAIGIRPPELKLNECYGAVEIAGTQISTWYLATSTGLYPLKLMPVTKVNI